MNENFGKALKSSNGITLIALIVTVVVLLILAGITVGLFTADNGVVKNATESQILSGLADIDEALEVYKIKYESGKINAGDYSGGLEDEQLVSAGVLKEVLITSTYRRIGVLSDFGELGVSSKLGKSGEKIDVSEISELNELYDVYVIDFTDGTLYYVRDGVWSIEGVKSEHVFADGSTRVCYEIETVSEEYVEKRKFITEWNITTAGTNIVLPLSGTTDVEIEWGDGSEKQKVTGNNPYPSHTYEEVGVYQIKIFGSIQYFAFDGTNYYHPSKNSISYITGIIQWGNLGSKIYKFKGCSNLGTSENYSTLPPVVFKETFSNLTDMSNMFNGCSNLVITTDDVKDWDTSNVTNMNKMFSGCSKISELDLSIWNTSKVTDMAGMFYECTGLQNINLQNFDTSNVTSLSSMFYHCAKLTEIDLSMFDTSKVTDMSWIFCNSTLSTINLTGWNTENVTNMSSMFRNMGNLTTLLGLEGFNTENVTNMSYMFVAGALQAIDVSSFNTSKVTNMDSMFRWCGKLQTLDLSNFDTSNVTYMRSMFIGCSNLQELDLSNFDTSNVTDMNEMFRDCCNLSSLNLGTFDTSKVTNMDRMFFNAWYLNTEITIRNSATTYTGMFVNTASRGTDTQGVKVNYIDDATKETATNMVATGGDKVVLGDLVE